MVSHWPMATSSGSPSQGEGPPLAGDAAGFPPEDGGQERRGAPHHEDDRSLPREHKQVITEQRPQLRSGSSPTSRSKDPRNSTSKRQLTLCTPTP